MLLLISTCEPHDLPGTRQVVALSTSHFTGCSTDSAVLNTWHGLPSLLFLSGCWVREISQPLCSITELDALPDAFNSVFIPHFLRHLARRTLLTSTNKPFFYLDFLKSWIVIIWTNAAIRQKVATGRNKVTTCSLGGYLWPVSKDWSDRSLSSKNTNQTEVN